MRCNRPWRGGEGERGRWDGRREREEERGKGSGRDTAIPV